LNYLYTELRKVRRIIRKNVIINDPSPCVEMRFSFPLGTKGIDWNVRTKSVCFFGSKSDGLLSAHR
jgi:hypothetical protein